MSTLQSRLRTSLATGPGATPRFRLGSVTNDGEPAWLAPEELEARLGGRTAALAAVGVRPGDVCVLCLPSDLACAELVLAVYLLGAVPLLVAPPVIQGTHRALREVLRSAVRRLRPRLVVLAAELAPQDLLHGVAPYGGRILHAAPDGPARSSGQLPALASLTADAVAGMQLTSGTTGRPRICLWSHRGMLAALDGMAAAMAVGPADSCLCWTPLYHDMGLVNNLLLCASAGMPLVLMTPHQFVKRPGVWLRALHATGATVTWSPNFGYALAVRRATAADLAGVRLDHVRAFYNAAERIHPATLREFAARFAPLGLRREAVLANFGCAEAIGGVTFDLPGGGWSSEWVDAERLERRGLAVVVDAELPGRNVEVAAVGRPAPGIGVAVVDRSGRPLGEGRVGELALATPTRMLGYHRDRRATRRALQGGLLRTGDLAYRRGEEVFWVGRLRERITVGGRKLDPSDFEAPLFALPELRTGCLAVFGIDDHAEGTQRVVVVAEVRDPAACDLADVRAAIRAAAMDELGVVLGDVRLVAPGTLDKTSSGKRRHRHAKRRYLAGELEDLAAATTAER